MAQTNFTPILTYKSDTASAVPSEGNLTNSANGAELAVNTADKRLFTKDSGGSVVELGTNPSSLTLPNGTANGVVYANGSKVLTTGSALTFDGTALGAARAIFTAADNAYATAFNATTGNLRVVPYDSTYSSTALVAYSSGYAGYGPISVDALNHRWWVSGSEQMRLTSTGLGIGTSSPAYKLDVRGGIIAAGNGTIVGGISYSTRPEIGAISNHPVGFITNNTTQMLLDSSGNLGLGVTPSAWGSVYKAVQNRNATFYDAANYGWGGLLFNAYHDNTNARYITGNRAGEYCFDVIGGTHAWFTAPSGTAGDAISFTQAMTLDASGNLGIGNTAPDSRLRVLGATSGTGPASLRIGFNSTSVNYFDADTQYFRKGDGTSTVTIDSSGNLLVGTTSVTNSPNQGVQLVNGSSIGGVFVGHANGTATGNYFATFSYDAGIIGSITQSGTTGVLYNITSDQRLKENIVDAPEFGSVIDSIKVRSYDWKADGNHQRSGFVAQELVTVAPEAVHQPADPEQMMAVDYSKLVPMLVKEIQSLRARVAALESI